MIAYDTDISSIISDVVFNTTEFVVDDAGGWIAESGDIVADTDKLDPTTEEPSITTRMDSTSLILSNNASIDTAYYLAGHSNIPGYDVVFNNVSSSILTSTNKAFRRVDVSADQPLMIDVTTSRDYFTFNDDNVGFGGEIGAGDFVSYQELAALCGVTGTPYSGPWVDRYIRFTMDGLEYIMPIAYINSNISWNKLLSLNLVYGDGVDYLGTPQQPKVLEIAGCFYIAELLSGADVNPVKGFTSDGLSVDRADTLRSQYRRLMNAIQSDNDSGLSLASYDIDDILKSLTVASLTTVTNRHERAVAMRGKRTGYIVKTNASTSLAWQPVLRRI